MLPGLLKEMRDVEVDDGQLGQVEAIIRSMTTAERAEPEIIDASRRGRIAKGSGTNPNQVNMLIKQFTEMQKMMKKMGGFGTKKAKKGRKAKNKKKGPGGGRVTQKSTARVTDAGGKTTKSPLMLPGLDRLDDQALDQLAEQLDELT